MLLKLLSDLRYRLRAAFHRSALERELDDELRFHLERETEKLERAGISHGEAVRRARIRFGGVDRAKEASRDGRGTALVESIVQDARYALRGLRATPGFTAGVVITLGLGIGANAAMFTVVDRMLLRPPAFLHDASATNRVVFTTTFEHRDYTDGALSYTRYRDLERHTHLFASLVAYSPMHVAVGDGESSRLRMIAGASGGFFALFDAQPVLGRFFTSADDSLLVSAPVVVASYAYWQSELGGRGDVLGERIRVGHTLCTLVGVAPKGFEGMDDGEVPQLYVPITEMATDLRPPSQLEGYGWRWLEMFAVRKPGIADRQANADLVAALTSSMIAEHAADPAHAPSVRDARPRVRLAPLSIARGPLGGVDSEIALWIAGVSVIVLLIACANAANLLLARAVTRRREIALRLALGVSRSRLGRQLFTESGLLALAGGALGLAVAQWGGAAIRALFLADAADTNVFVDTRTLWATLLVSVIVALLTGTAPVLHATRHDLARSIAGGARETDGRSIRVRGMLLLVQATLSVVLLIGAGLFVRSLHKVQQVHLGFDVDPIVVVTDNSRGVKLTDEQREALEARLVDAADHTPGIVSATPAPTVPYWAYTGKSLYVDGIDSVGVLGQFILQAGNADYFRTMGTRLLRGRGFTAGDRADSPPVMVVSEGMAAALWPRENALGRCVRIGADTMPCTTVVGISEEARMSALIGDREFTYYVPVAQFGTYTGMLLVRVVGQAEDQTELVRRALQRVMPSPAYVTAQPFRTIVAPRMKSWQLGATMFTAFGGLALALAAFGLYSVIAYGVAQRRRELGIRVALGARPLQIVRLVMGGGLRVVIAGVVLGTAAAYLAGPRVSGLLFQESSRDAFVYAAVAALLIFVAIVATVAPAASASRVDATVTLRAE